MTDRSKGPVVALAALLVIAITAAFLGFIALQKEKENNAILLEENNELEVRKRSAERQVSDLRMKVDGLNQDIVQQKAKINDYERQIAVVNNELAQEKKSKENAMTEVFKLKNMAESLGKEKADLEARFRLIEDELNFLKDQLSAAENAKKELEPKAADTLKPSSPAVKEAQAKPADVQLDKIVVPAAVAAAPDDSNAPKESKKQVPAGAGSAVSALEGIVLVVNREYDFIVINLGEKDNLKIGDAFEVISRNKPLGEVRVEEVRDTMSVATPIAKDIIKSIKEDDKVVRK